MSNNILNFFIILFFYEYIDLINTSCPPDLIIKPCLCIHETPYKNYLSPLDFKIISADEKLILCENIHNSSFNLQEVFVKLSSYSNIISNDDQNATYFNYFILSNTSITSIPENVFVNITFRSLMLRNNFQLTTIHKNAFSSGKDYVESFETMNTSLSDTETIFSIIKQFENLRHLSMQNDRLKFIPSYAFNHTYLTNVYFGSEGSLSQTQPIESIGDYAFYNLPNLYLLRIFSPNLTKISKYAFARRKRFVLYDDGPNMLHLYMGGEGLNSTLDKLLSSGYPYT